MVVLRTTCVLLTALSRAASVTSRLVGIPTVPFTTSGDGAYSVTSLKALVVDSNFAESRDETGETLIPPTLQDFAKTFAADLSSVLDLDISLSNANEATQDSIFLTLGEPSKYVDVTGAPTAEGYTLSVNSSGIVISGASPLGAWWGTRTILQQALLSNSSIPYGEGDDAPGWRTRGMMLDAGRHYYPPEFVIELCAYMSFFKQNIFQLHLSDNLYNNVNLYSREQSLQLGAWFRLWSESEDLAGLAKYKNESYTKDQFDEMQSACASRGVTVIPEIEAPGHSLSIVQWKPELALSSDLSQLNISYPDTIPTMKTIWSTFLPWFQSKTVHIGADEYTGDVNEYNRFVNVMAGYIHQESGKAIRIWGTFPPKPEYDNVYRNVSIQHWEFFEDDPYHDYILNNYSVLNSDDTFYTVAKWSGSYPQVVDVARTFDGDPADGGLWQPFVFDTRTAANNPERADPRVLGAVTPLWNDYGPNATVYSEAFYTWRDGIPALADKQWGGDLSASEFAAASAPLLPRAPSQNLARAVASVSPTVLDYRAAEATRRRYFGALGSGWRDAAVPDRSGNGYDASTDCAVADAAVRLTPSCAFRTPLSSKGRDYALSLRLRVDEVADGTRDAVLASGADSELRLTPALSFLASGNYYRLNATTVPLGRWVDLTVVGRGNQTFARVTETALDAALPELGGSDGDDGEEFFAVLGVNGQSLVWAPIAIEAPIGQIGGADSNWSGQLAAMRLSSEA
ncbi:glycoside hydrolase family 20 protein [Hypoxylon sp. FL1284]|nr:glycoside hydrolase family 20 protein [Hypoxylon sp. FL1284]